MEPAMACPGRVNGGTEGSYREVPPLYQQQDLGQADRARKPLRRWASSRQQGPFIKSRPIWSNTPENKIEDPVQNRLMHHINK